jgi:hypothetical protein
MWTFDGGRVKERRNSKEVRVACSHFLSEAQNDSVKMFKALVDSLYFARAPVMPLECVRLQNTLI